MSCVTLEEEADYGRLLFNIFLSVSFSHLPFDSVLTLARRTGGITMPPGTRLGIGESEADGALCVFLFPAADGISA